MFLIQILLPLCKPILASQALFAFMGNWNSYLWPLIVTNRDEMRTLQIGLRYFVSGEGGTQWGLYMAAAVLICLPGRGRSPVELLQGRLRFGDYVADGIEKRGVTPFAVA